MNAGIFLKEYSTNLNKKDPVGYLFNVISEYNEVSSPESSTEVYDNFNDVDDLQQLEQELSVDNKKLLSNQADTINNAEKITQKLDELIFDVKNNILTGETQKNVSEKIVPSSARKVEAAQSDVSVSNNNAYNIKYDSSNNLNQVDESQNYISNNGTEADTTINSPYLNTVSSSVDNSIVTVDETTQAGNSNNIVSSEQVDNTSVTNNQNNSDISSIDSLNNERADSTNVTNNQNNRNNTNNSDTLSINSLSNILSNEQVDNAAITNNQNNPSTVDNNPNITNNNVASSDILSNKQVDEVDITSNQNDSSIINEVSMYDASPIYKEAAGDELSAKDSIEHVFKLSDNKTVNNNIDNIDISNNKALKPIDPKESTITMQSVDINHISNKDLEPPTVTQTSPITNLNNTSKTSANNKFVFENTHEEEGDKNDNTSSAEKGVANSEINTSTTDSFVDSSQKSKKVTFKNVLSSPIISSEKIESLIEKTYNGVIQSPAPMEENSGSEDLIEVGDIESAAKLLETLGSDKPMANDFIWRAGEGIQRFNENDNILSVKDSEAFDKLTSNEDTPNEDTPISENSNEDAPSEDAPSSEESPKSTEEQSPDTQQETPPSTDNESSKPLQQFNRPKRQAKFINPNDAKAEQQKRLTGQEVPDSSVNDTDQLNETADNASETVLEANASQDTYNTMIQEEMAPLASSEKITETLQKMQTPQQNSASFQTSDVTLMSQGTVNNYTSNTAPPKGDAGFHTEEKYTGIMPSQPRDPAYLQRVKTWERLRGGTIFYNVG